MKAIVKYISKSKKSVMFEVTNHLGNGFKQTETAFIEHDDAGKFEIGKEIKDFPEGMVTEERTLIEEESGEVKTFKWWVKKA